MYKHCTTEKTLRQQQLVEECLMELLQKQPYDKITVTMLCGQAGITRRIFYRLFDTKDDVLLAIIDHTLMEYPMVAISDNREPAVVKAAIEKSLLFWIQQKPLLDALKKNAAIGFLIERTINYTANHSPEALRTLRSENDPNRMYTVRFCIMGIMGLIIEWHNSNYKKPLQEMIEIEYQLLTSALVSLAEGEF